jgi:hypothetical protein
MRWRKTMKFSNGVSLTLATLAVLTLAPNIRIRAEQSKSAEERERPVAEILSPKDGEDVPRTSDACEENHPCRRIYVSGRIAKGYWPFLAVTPLAAAPNTWIQPMIFATKSDGTFEGIVNLGDDHSGRQEKFAIMILAHKNKMQYFDGQVLQKIPPDVLHSDPVTVFRTR